jgi:hypothetical protein
MFGFLPLVAAASQSWGAFENGLYQDKTGV